MLTSMRMVNYRCHADSTIEFGSRMTLLLGGNQAGKSSVRLALEAALTNRNEMTNERGTGLRQQIRSGQLEASIHVTDDGGRSASLELPIGTRGGDLRGGEMAVRACLRRGWFLGLPAKEQRAFLQQDVWLAGGMSTEDWRSELNGWTPEFPDLGDWWLETFSPQTTDREALYTDAFASRKVANASLKRLEAELVVPLPPMPPGVEGDEADLRRKRDEVHEEIARLRAERSAREQTAAAARSAWQSEVRRHDDAQRRVDEAQRRVEALADQAVRANQLRGKGSKSLASLRKKLDNHLQALELGSSRLQSVQAELEDFGRQEGTCPAGVCARAEMARLTTALREASLEVKTIGSAVEKVRAEIVEAERRDAEADALARQSAAAEEAVQETLRAQAELGSPPDAPVEVGDDGFEAMLAHRQEHLRVIDVQLQAHQQAQAAIAVRNAAVEARGRTEHELEAIRDEVGRLNGLVDAKTGALTESGVIERRWKVDLAAFIGQVNAELETFGLRVIVDDPWQIVVDNGHARVPVDQVSMAEYTWVSAAFQVAIARRTGVPMIALDEMGNLDGVRRRVFYQWAMGLGDVQVLLIAAAQDTERGHLVRPARAGQAGLAVYWCEGGALYPLGVEEKAA